VIRRPSRPVVAALLSVALLALVVRPVPQGLYSDPAWQLIGVEQFLSGAAPTPNTAAKPASVDFSTDQFDWVTWWAPGTPLLALAPMTLGLSIGATLRGLALVCLIAGAIGWTLWISSFDLPPGVTIAIALLLPWMRYASSGAFQFSAETLVFGAAPWPLLAALRAGRDPSRTMTAVSAAAVGAIAGVVYWLKYSWALAAVGVIAWFVWRRAKSKQARIAAMAGALVPIVALSLLNIALAGHANLVTAAIAIRVAPVVWLAGVGAPSVMWFDLEALLRYVLFDPSTPWLRETWWPLLAGLPAAFWLWARVKHARVGDAGELAMAVWLSSVLFAILTWTLSRVSVECRHVATAGLATMPLVVSVALRDLRSRDRARKLASAAVLIVYIIVPAIYGVASVFAKSYRVPAGYQTGPAGIYNPLLSDRNLAACREALVGIFDRAHDTWYATDPVTALDLPGRAIVTHADFESIAELTTTYRTSRAGRVLALLPATFEANGKGVTIRGSFPQAQGWARVVVPCAPQLWIATLDAGR